MPDTKNTHQLPATTGLDLGSDSQRWDVYGQNVDVSGNLNLNNATLTGSFTGNMTGNVTGNVTGAVTGGRVDSTSGTLLPGQLDQIRLAGRFSGADLGAKITAAIADLGGNGGIVWALDQGAQAISSTVTIPTNVTVVLGMSTITTSVFPAFTLSGQGARLIGSGRYNTVVQGNGGTIISMAYSRTEVRDLKVYCTGSSASNIGIKLDGQAGGGSIGNGSIFGCDIYGTSNVGTGVLFYAALKNTVMDCGIESWEKGFDYQSYGGVRSNANDLVGNKIRVNYKGVYVTDADDVNMYGNTVEGNNYGFYDNGPDSSAGMHTGLMSHGDHWENNNLFTGTFANATNLYFHGNSSGSSLSGANFGGASTNRDIVIDNGAQVSVHGGYSNNGTTVTNGALSAFATKFATTPTASGTGYVIHWENDRIFHMYNNSGAFLFTNTGGATFSGQVTGTAITATTSVTAPFLKSSLTNPASIGLVRAINSDYVFAARNAANNGDKYWFLNSSNVWQTDADMQLTDTFGGMWRRGVNTELLTLNTGGLTTDTSANLLPANSIIEAVVCRVTTTITTTTNWAVGDSVQSARFSSPNATLTAGTTSVGLNHQDPTVATANLGPVQTSAAKVRITCTGSNPGAGAIRISVFYRQFVPPTS